MALYCSKFYITCIASHLKTISTTKYWNVFLIFKKFTHFMIMIFHNPYLQVINVEENWNRSESLTPTCSLRKGRRRACFFFEWQNGALCSTRRVEGDKNVESHFLGENEVISKCNCTGVLLLTFLLELLFLCCTRTGLVTVKTSIVNLAKLTALKLSLCCPFQLYFL